MSVAFLFGGCVIAALQLLLMSLTSKQLKLINNLQLLSS